jgi:hypothetical protein
MANILRQIYSSYLKQVNEIAREQVHYKSFSICVTKARKLCPWNFTERNLSITLIA